jgi:membrane protein
LGAALAYYALFSMAPLLVLIVAVSGLVLGPAAARGEVVTRMEGLVGPDAAHMLEGMITRVSSPSSGIIATLVSLITILLGASGVFGQLQASLNRIWDVPPTSRGVRGLVRQRLASLGIIVGIGILMVASLVLTAALAAVQEVLAQYLPVVGPLLPSLNFGLSLLVTSALFAMIYKVLPDVPMSWGDVWIGAFATALLFTVGKTLIGLYLGRAGTASVYGAAGSLVVLLLWVYYSAQILFIGAELTEVYSRRYGSRRERSPS